MLDPINLVHAYHATREVHRDYVRGLDDESDEKASAATGHSIWWPHPISWLARLLASTPGERRLTTTPRHHA